MLAYSPLEYRDTLHLIAEGKMNCAPLVTGTVGLVGVDQAFTALGDSEKHADHGTQRLADQMYKPTSANHFLKKIKDWRAV